MCRTAGPRGQGDREAEPGGQGDAEAWDGRVSRSKETGTPGQEYWRGRAVIGWTGALGREDSKKRRKRGRRPKDLFGRCLEERCGFIPAVPTTAQPRGLATSQVDKTIYPQGRSSEGLGRCGRGEEVTRTDGGNGDGVVVARMSRTAHPSPQGAHNLTRSGKDAIVWRLRAA